MPRPDSADNCPSVSYVTPTPSDTSAKNPLPVTDDLVSANDIFKRYQTSIIDIRYTKKAKEKKMIREAFDSTENMECKLAREAFYGDSVLIASTFTGKGEFYPLDPSKWTVL